MVAHIIYPGVNFSQQRAKAIGLINRYFHAERSEEAGPSSQGNAATTISTADKIAPSQGHIPVRAISHIAPSSTVTKGSSVQHQAPSVSQATPLTSITYL